VPLASDWSNLLTSLLPFAVLILFWIFLMNRRQSTAAADPQQQMLEKLDEIREELVRLRKSIESRP
jgi:preprotein translocase subunit YajC